MSFIAGYLRNLGFEVRERVEKTGVTGLPRGARGGKTLLYRADMDALRVREDNVVPYRSRPEDVAHVCSHDPHMALALTAAKLLNGMKDEIAGNDKFIFQPNAKLAPGGAQRRRSRSRRGPSHTRTTARGSTSTRTLSRWGSRS